MFSLLLLPSFVLQARQLLREPRVVHVPRLILQRVCTSLPFSEERTQFALPAFVLGLLGEIHTKPIIMAMFGFLCGKFNLKPFSGSCWRKELCTTEVPVTKLFRKPRLCSTRQHRKTRSSGELQGVKRRDLTWMKDA